MKTETNKDKDQNVVYVLKRCRSGFEGYGGFKYPKRGWVEAPSWEEEKTIKNGLFGLENAIGSFDITVYRGMYLVLKVDKRDGYVGMGDKVKFRRGYVVKYSENGGECVDYIISKVGYIDGMNLCQSTEQVSRQGYHSTSNQGDGSTSNQGYWSTSNQGGKSTSNQGGWSTSNQGDGSTSNQGGWSTSNQGDGSTSNQEDWSTSNQGDRSTSNQGRRSTSNQGNGSTSNQRDYSTSNQGYRSTSNQGHCSTSNQGHCSTSNQKDGSTSNQRGESVSVVHGTDCVYRNGSHRFVLVLFHRDGKTVYTDENIGKNTSVYITDCEITHKYTHTPNVISKLERHEIFVFGSNLGGRHSGGAAKLACERFGAEPGCGEGLRGQSYAFPTLGKGMEKLDEARLTKAVDNLVKTANNNTRKVFLVTKVGCGIAGFDEGFMSTLFKNRNDISANIILPKGWRNTDE